MVRFFDPKKWTDEKNYGNDAITSFAGHFQATLAAAGYDSTKVHNEITLKFGSGTRKLKIFGRSLLILEDAITQMCAPSQRFNCDKRIKLEHRACLNTFTNILSNACFSMKHRRKELMLIIGANDENLSDVDRSEIIAKTLDIHLKRKKKKKEN